MGDIRSKPNNKAWYDNFDVAMYGPGGVKPGGNDGGPRCRICGRPGATTAAPAAASAADPAPPPTPS